MAKLKAIYSQESYSDKSELRIDWDNDRYQSVTLKDDSPESVINSLLDMARVLASEIKHREI